MTTVKIEINIDKICEKLNTSKLGLARLLEVSPKTIFNWQKGIHILLSSTCNGFLKRLVLKN